MANTARRLRFRNCMAHSPTSAHSAPAARPPSIFIVCKSAAFALQRAIPIEGGFFHLTRGRAGRCLAPRPALEWPHAKANPPSIRRPPAPMLANLLRRYPSRNLRGARRQPARYPPLGTVLRLLSRLASRRTSERNGGDTQRRSRTFARNVKDALYFLESGSVVGAVAICVALIATV
jgi:hypothetical protein